MKRVIMFLLALILTVFFSQVEGFAGYDVKKSETIKKSLLTGVGMALRSKSEIEELAKEFAENSKMNQAEAREFLNECRQKYEDAKLDLDHKIEAAIETIMGKLDLPSRSDIEKLNDRVDKLTRKLEEKE